jgi:multidrug efflux pump subunit AcrA (membrane-fusion protein)
VVKAEALLEQARLDLEKTTIRAPFSGPVLAVFAAPGNHSNLNTPLVEIADASGYEVRVQIPDAYAEQFYLAQSEATERITAVAESGARLTLARLASQVRTGQTGMDAFFVFDQANEHAPALGRVFNLSIELPAQAQLIAVPVQSIYENNRVYAVRDGRLVGHDIERVGEQESAEHGYQILIRTGEIQPGDDVITTQLPRAITGLLVDVANRSKSESG